MPTHSHKDSALAPFRPRKVSESSKDQQIQEKILKEAAQPRQSTSVKDALDKRKRAPVSVALPARGHRTTRPRRET
jgi:hypothetical protein